MMRQTFTQLTYNALVRLAANRSPLVRAAWGRAWDVAWRHLSGSVNTTIHGHRVVVNAGYTYPAYSRRWPTYNDPLVEVVHQAKLAKGSAVNVVDVGAAIGDTVLLILERCPGEVGEIDCVEGDAEFFSYLRRNLADITAARLHRVMLSDAVGDEAGLVRTHKGTASAQGDDRLPATTLDSVLGVAGASAVDVLKIDTDGFDGKVLAGATGILDRDRPAVIFEWHPLLYEATGQDWHRPFEVLAANGYRWLVWFDKYGTFSHLEDGYRKSAIDVLASLCLSGRAPGPDWHYDVVALPEGSVVDPSDMAALSHARAR
jgi:FkbM family methyltransferase